MTTTREHEQRHHDALAIIGAHEQEVVLDASHQPAPLLPSWLPPLLTDLRRRVERHTPVVLRDLEGETGPVRCAGHRPRGVPRHLLTVVDHPTYPCDDVAPTLLMLVGPEPAADPPPAAAHGAIVRAPQTWSSSR